MLLLSPSYYKNFTCINSSCKDNCCRGGWEIDIDDETANYYLIQTGPCGDLLKSVISHTDEYCFKLKDNHCPLLTDDGLCGIYDMLGPDHLGYVCDQFPRFSEYYGSIKETGIGLACEEAARLILFTDYPSSLNSCELMEEVYESEEFDAKLYDKLSNLRTILFRCIKANTTSISDLDHTLNQLAIAFDQMQEAINDNDYNLLGQIIENLKLSDIDPESNLTSYESIGEFLDIYLSLDSLNNKFKDLAHECLELLHQNEEDEDKFKTCLSDYSASLDSKQLDAYAKLINYFIFRYLTEAAYDHDLKGKLILIIANYLVLRDLDLLSFSKGQDLEPARIENAKIFSREVEYDRENIEALYEEFLFF